MTQIQKKVETILAQLEQDKQSELWWYMPYMLISAASVYFETCPDDFCVQLVGERAIVFGGTNRLIYTCTHGFTPDTRYCTEEFLHHCERIGPNPRREHVG